MSWIRGANRSLHAPALPSPFSREIRFRAAEQMDREKLMKMAASVRTGGKGSMRRKKKAVHKAAPADDKKLHTVLKRLGVNPIDSVEEVHMFKDDVVIHFLMPKVEVCLPANTWVVSGKSQTKNLQDILPGILNQLGPDNLESLKKLAEQMRKQTDADTKAEDDDDVPDLVAGETFESAAADDDDLPELVVGETFGSAAADGS